MILRLQRENVLLLLRPFCHHSPAFLSRGPLFVEFGFIVYRQIQYAQNKSRFASLAILSPSRFAKSLSLSPPLLLIFESVRSSSRFSFSSPVRTSLCRGSMFAIRDRAAATRIMTLVTRKSSWPKRSAELVPARSSASFTYSASFFSSLDPLTILSQLPFPLFSSISYQKSSKLNACNRLIH